VDENWFLAALTPQCRAFLHDRLVAKDVIAGQLLFKAGEPIEALIFPLDGIISLQTEIGQDQRVENLAVGLDSVIGAQVLMGETHHGQTAVALLSGKTLWLPKQDFIEALELFPCVRPAVSASMARGVRRLMQGVACANVHSAVQRIATWLLHVDDRVSAGGFDLTQKTLSEVFALRPATVSDSCSKLLASGAIHYARGRISILDRACLLQHACACYEAVSHETLKDLGDINLRF